jgi:hypothetical protein
MIAVFLPVDNEFFLGFAVQSHPEDSVLLAFVVSVAAWENSGHRRTPSSIRFHSGMTHLPSDVAHAARGLSKPLRCWRLIEKTESVIAGEDDLLDGEL